MCRIIVECSTITGSTAYSASGILVKNANFPEEADRNRKRLPSGGRHQSGQSTVLLKNVVPVEGTASCVFVKRKSYGLTARYAVKPLPLPSSGVACHREKYQRSPTIFCPVLPQFHRGYSFMCPVRFFWKPVLNAWLRIVFH